MSCIQSTRALLHALSRRRPLKVWRQQEGSPGALRKSPRDAERALGHELHRAEWDTHRLDDLGPRIEEQRQPLGCTPWNAVFRAPRWRSRLSEEPHDDAAHSEAACEVDVQRPIRRENQDDVPSAGCAPAVLAHCVASILGNTGDRRIVVCIAKGLPRQRMQVQKFPEVRFAPLLAN